MLPSGVRALLEKRRECARSRRPTNTLCNSDSFLPCRLRAAEISRGSLHIQRFDVRLLRQHCVDRRNHKTPNQSKHPYLGHNGSFGCHSLQLWGFRFPVDASYWCYCWKHKNKARISYLETSCSFISYVDSFYMVHCVHYSPVSSDRFQSLLTVSSQFMTGRLMLPGKLN